MNSGRQPVVAQAGKRVLSRLAQWRPTLGPQIIMVAEQDIVTAAEAPRVVAFHLPQFHPIPENDEWWEPGFTEWTNVAAARPLFRGHRPAASSGELGFYDLRVAESGSAGGARRARGVGAFCYWHYWFAGRRLLAAPLRRGPRLGRAGFPVLPRRGPTRPGPAIWHGAPTGS